MPTTTLPLQERALAVGGDTQQKVTDEFEATLTPQQLAEAEKECKAQAEVTTETCRTIIRQTLPGNLNRNGCTGRVICVHAYRLQDDQLQWVIEIRDERPEGRRCDADPARVCMRFGVRPGTEADGVLSARTGVSPTPTATPTDASPTDPTRTTTVTGSPSESTNGGTGTHTATDTGTGTPTTQTPSTQTPTPSSSGSTPGRPTLNRPATLDPAPPILKP